jgi:hypothetical protein
MTNTCITQIKSTAPGEAVFMQVNGGDIRNGGGGPTVATGFCGKWFNLKVAINPATLVTQVWVNNCLKDTGTKTRNPYLVFQERRLRLQCGPLPANRRPPSVNPYRQLAEVVAPHVAKRATGFLERVDVAQNHLERPRRDESVESLEPFPTVIPVE